MKLLVLGATGGIGREIVCQAADHGHKVTAFVRARDGLDALGGRINTVQGDLLNPSQLESVLAGQDAVASGFGPRVPIAKTDSHLLRTFANALTDAMSHSGVGRVIAVSVAFLFRDSIIPPAYLAGRLFFPDLVADAADMEHIFENSGLDWTIVRPPRLTDKPGTGAYRVKEDHLPPFGFAISRADVADFMLKCAAGSSGYAIDKRRTSSPSDGNRARESSLIAATKADKRSLRESVGYRYVAVFSAYSGSAWA